MFKPLLFAGTLFLSVLTTNAQLIDNFDDNTLTNWFAQSCYSIAETNQELAVTATNAFNYQVFNKQSLNEDFSTAKTLYVKIKTTSAVTVRIDLGDVNPKTTNSNALSITPTADGAYHVYTLDFNNRFRQSFPSAALVDSTAITQVIIFLNPAGPAFTGTVYIDSIGHDAGALLPVHFIAFTGQLTNDKVKLSFMVAEETSVDKYIIKRSSNNLQWQRIAEIKPLNTNTTAEYSFTDLTPLNGSNIYRVEMINKFGAAVNSEMWQCRFKNTIYTSQLIYTSPGQYQIHFNNTLNDPPLFVYTYAFSGQLLKKTAVSIGQQILPLNQTVGGFAVIKYQSGKQEALKIIAN